MGGAGEQNGPQSQRTARLPQHLQPCACAASRWPHLLLSDPPMLRRRVGSLTGDEHLPGTYADFIGSSWASPADYCQRGQCHLLLMQLPPDDRCCTRGSGGNLVFAPPARELETHGYFLQPDRSLPRRAQQDPQLRITLWLTPAWQGRGWPGAPKWIVDLRKKGAFTVLATRAGAANHTPEAQLQPYFVDNMLKGQLEEIVESGLRIAAEMVRALAGGPRCWEAGWRRSGAVQPDLPATPRCAHLACTRSPTPSQAAAGRDQEGSEVDSEDEVAEEVQGGSWRRQRAGWAAAAEPSCPPPPPHAHSTGPALSPPAPAGLCCGQGGGQRTGPGALW